MATPTAVDTITSLSPSVWRLEYSDRLLPLPATIHAAAAYQHCVVYRRHEYSDALCMLYAAMVTTFGASIIPFRFMRIVTNVNRPNLTGYMQFYIIIPV